MKSMAKMSQKDPTNMDIRRHLNQKKQYKKLLKHKNRKWNERIIAKLARLESDDPKQYWNLINELQKIPENNDITAIDKFEKFSTDLFAKYTHGEKSTHDLISKNVGRY